MKKTSWILVLVGLTLAALVAAGFPFQSLVLAAPNPQLTNFPTPTPGSDGRIIYIVQDGDTLWRIAAVSGLNIADLRDLNFLGVEDIVFPGRQEEEISVLGGAINISNRDGSISITEDTPEHDPDSLTDDYFCTENLGEGDYNVSVAIPEGYNPTTSLNTGIELFAGDTTFLTFGAQAGSVVIEEDASLPETTGSTPLLGVIGAILLLSGIGLGVYSVWFRR